MERGLAAAVKNFARTNIHGIVFRADATEQQVVFSNERSLPGEELALNFIQLKPYFVDDE